MIPNLAIIVAAYAAARLLNEYLFIEGNFSEATVKGARTALALFALIAVGIALIGILSASSQLSDLGI